MGKGKYAVVIAARMSSERLPGKALVAMKDGQLETPNVELIVRRWLRSDRSPIVIVATSDQAEDDAIELMMVDTFTRWADYAPRVAVYRGSRDNVAERMDGAVRAFAPDATHIARALADNPIVDVGLADWRLDVLRDLEADGVHYGGREGELTYCATTDVWSRPAWDRILQGSSGSQLEHPGTYYWENLHKFRAARLTMPRAEYLADVRTELDTPDDLRMFRALYEAMGTGAPDTLSALRWLADHPEVAAINAEVRLKTHTRAVMSEGTEWTCPECSRRLGGVVNGDLTVRCACGTRRKFYARPPGKIGPAGLTGSRRREGGAR